MQGFKTFILMLAMTMFFLVIGYSVGGESGLLIAFIFAGIGNFVSYWFSDKIVLSMYKAQEIPQTSSIYKITKRLSKQANLPMPKLYMINERQPNAFATGRNPQHAALAVTRGLVELMDENEISGVIGHELGHIANRDILIQTVAATMAGAIVYLSNVAKWSALFGGRSSRDRKNSNDVFTLLAISLFAPLGAMLIKMAISRTREFKADSFGAKVSGNPRHLSNALRKLELYSNKIPMPDVVASTENMFIISPLAGGKLSNLFSTHPKTSERIERLENL